MRQRFLATLFIGLVAVGALASESLAQQKPEAAKPAKMKVAFALLSTDSRSRLDDRPLQGNRVPQEEGDERPDRGRLHGKRPRSRYRNGSSGTTPRTVMRSSSPRPSSTWIPHSWSPRIFPRSRSNTAPDTRPGQIWGTTKQRMEQAEYLAGYTAGLMGYKNVGTVATQPIPEPIRGINAFTLGLLRGLKEANHHHDPRKVNTVVWLKKWLDPINEVVLAETLINQQHDLIRQMADTPDSARNSLLQESPNHWLRDGRAAVRGGLRAAVHDLELGPVLRGCGEAGHEQDLEATGDLLGLQGEPDRPVILPSLGAQACSAEGTGRVEEDEKRGRTIPSSDRSRTRKGR